MKKEESIFMTTIERCNKLLQLSTIRAKEIETEIESGELDEPRDLNENINGIIKKLNDGLIQFRRKCLMTTNLWVKSNNGLQIKN